MAGVWKRDGTIAVTKGSKKVVGTGTTFADPKNAAAKGHLLVMVTGTAVDLYEVDYSESNSVFYLVEAYRGDTGTGKAYAIDTSRTDSIPEFARRLNATLGAYQQQGDAFQALLTSDAATIEVTAPDGTKHTMIPWKRVTSEGEGQAARAKVEADKAAASAALAGGIVEASALPLPDVWAPLSDSLRLITGYGRDVVVGSDVVARMVNFSRSTTATYTGKDGLPKTAAVNEPRFEKEGLLLEGPSQNIVPISNFPQTLAGWGTPNPTGNLYSYVTAPDGTSTAVKVSFAGDGFNQSFASLVNGTVYTFSFYAKNDTATPVLLSIIIGAGAASTELTIPANTGWARYQATQTFVAGDTRLRWYFTTKNVEVSLWGAQLEALPFASSYIPTAGAAVTRAADQAWIPAAGNRFIGGLYATAFEFDLLGRVASGVSEFSRLVDFDNSGGSDRQHISLTVGGQLQCLMGPSQALASVAGKLAGRAAMRMNNFTMNVMMDGVAGSSVTASGVGSSLNNRIVLMNSNLFNLPSYGHIRNLRMWSKHPISNDQLRTAV